MRRQTILLTILLIASSISARAWEISNYQVQAQILEDSKVNITEKIVANFGMEPHHGIYRDIPLAGQDKWRNNYVLRISDINVTDDSGTPQQAKISHTGRSVIHIRIGDPDSTITGVKTYLIRYSILRGIHFFSDSDELYFNAIGQQWDVPIQSASCDVIFPKVSDQAGIRVAAYTGTLGSTSCDATLTRMSDNSERFMVSRPLNPGEGLTVVVGLPKGTVHPPSLSSEFVWFVMDNGWVLVIILFVGAIALLWHRMGRDPDTGRSVAVRYDPPESLSPAELGTLIDELVDARDISAEIVNLAVRGFLTIKSSVEKGMITSHTEYTLVLTKPNAATVADPTLTAFQQRLVSNLFGGMDFVVVSSLQNTFYAYLPKLQEMLYDSLIQKGYFSHSPDKIRKGYLLAGIIVLICGIAIANIILSLHQVPLGWALVIPICGLALAIASRFMPRKTAKGKNAYLAVKGFEEYLSRAEKTEIEYQQRNDYFDKFLPYAMALGIADKWAHAFEGIQTEPPQWYVGYHGMFSPIGFSHDMNHATSNWSSAMASTPRTSGSSGSGGFFSGGSGFSGGSSGGGSGGGGGGGW